MLDAGALDESFGDSGVAILDFQQRLDFAHAVAVQSDGMVLVAGNAGRLEGVQSKTELAVVRFTTDGELDGGFGEGGIVTLNLGEDVHSQANAIAVQDDGKIVVVGETFPANQLLVLRFNADGTVDETFNGGLVATELSSAAHDVVLQEDGKIVLVGDAQGPLGFQFFLLRLNEDGSFDENFGEQGIQVTDTLRPDGSAAAVALQDDGKIIVTGYGEFTDPARTEMITARYDSTGDLDVGYGDNGLVITSITTTSKAADLAIDNQNRAIVAGTDDQNLVLVRYDLEGNPDSTFDQDGVLVVEDLNPNPSNEGTIGAALVIQPDGKLLVTAEGGNDFVLLRLNANGTLDESFNGVGKVVTDLQVTFDSSSAIALHDDGKIVVSGISGADWAVVQYLGDEVPVVPPWQNPTDRFDVSGDGNVVPLDVLRIVNELNDPTVAGPNGELPATRPDGAAFYDVDGNGFITPLDALGVINFLNRPPGGEGESVPAADRDLYENVLDLLLWEWDRQSRASQPDELFSFLDSGGDEPP